METYKQLSYTQFLKNAKFNDDNVDIDAVNTLIQKVQPLISNALPFAPGLFGIDYRSDKYLFWENNHNGFGGYTGDFFMNNGHRDVLDFVNPLHLSVVSDKIFPTTLNALQTVKPNEQIISSFNYKGKDINGKDFTVFQKCVYVLSNETGLPLYCVGIGMDVSSFKKDDFMYHTIESLDTTTNKIKLLQEFTYNPNPEVFLRLKKRW
jgi:hypothetical protein